VKTIQQQNGKEGNLRRKYLAVRNFYHTISI